MQALLRTRGLQDNLPNRAIGAVLNWARGKWPTLVPVGIDAARDFEHDQPGLELAAVDLPERGIWGFRVEHPDSQIPGRTWLLEAIVSSPKGPFHVLGVRSQCSSGAMDDVPFTSPRFIRTWLEDFEVVDADWRIKTSMTLIEEDAGVRSLVALLEDPQRTLPVIVVSELPRGGFCVEADRLASRSPGLSHVVRLTAASASSLSDVVGADLGVFNGAVRTYLPGFGQPDDSQVHAVYLPSRILTWRGVDGEGRGAFQDFLVEQLHRFSVRTPARLEQMPSFLQLRRKKAERELNAHRSRETHAAGAGQSAVPTNFVAIQSKLQEAELEIDLLKLEKRDAEQKAADAELLFDAQSEDLRAVKNERDALKAINASIFDGLRRARANTSQTEHRPTSYEEVADWVDQTLSHRLVLLPRARRALGDAVYEDVSLVVSCLELLAGEYWGLRTSSPEERDAAAIAYQARLSFLEVDEAPSSSAQMRGRFEEQYSVDYPIRHRSRQQLDRHLRCGNSREARFCLRIYYLWDDEQQKVVVGHLPSHLDTPAS